jgi:hypothetical protein
MEDRWRHTPSHRRAAQQRAPARDVRQDADALFAPRLTRDGRESYIMPAPDFERYLDELRALGFEF